MFQGLLAVAAQENGVLLLDPQLRLVDYNQSAQLLLGQALKGKRNSVVIASKFGIESLDDPSERGYASHYPADAHRGTAPGPKVRMTWLSRSSPQVCGCGCSFTSAGSV